MHPRRGIGLERELRHADHRVHRRADLVRHVGQEVGLGACGVLGRLLGALELGLGLLERADVGQGHDDAVLDQLAADQQAAFLAVLAADAVFLRRHLAVALLRLLDQGEPGLLHLLPVGRVGVGPGPPVRQRRNVVPFVAEQLGEAPVDRGELVAAQMEQPDRRGFEQHPQLLVGQAQRLGCGPLGADVVDDPDRATCRIAGVDRVPDDACPYRAAVAPLHQLLTAVRPALPDVDIGLLADLLVVLFCRIPEPGRLADQCAVGPAQDLVHALVAARRDPVLEQHDARAGGFEDGLLFRRHQAQRFAGRALLGDVIDQRDDAGCRVGRVDRTRRQPGPVAAAVLALELQLNHIGPVIADLAVDGVVLALPALVVAVEDPA